MNVDEKTCPPLTGEKPSLPPEIPPDPPNRRQFALSPEAVEFLVVLSFAYAPSLFTSLLLFSNPGPDQSKNSAVEFFAYFAQMATIAIPLLYIMKLNGV